MKRNFENGHPFDDTVKENLNILFKESHIGIGSNKRTQGTVVVIDGDQGTGKTTTGINWCDYLNSLAGMGPVVLEKGNHPQLSRGQKEFFTNLEKCRALKLPAIVYDEAGDYSRAGYNTKENIKLNYIWQQIRSTRVIVFLILPKHFNLPPTLFNEGIVRWLAHLENEEHDATLTKLSVYCEGTPGNGGPRRFNQLRHITERTPNSFKQFTYTQVIPEHWGYLRIGLTEERAKKLDELSDQGKSLLRIESGLQAQGLLSTKDILTRLNINVNSFPSIKRKYGIKPSKTIGVKHYYHKDIIEQLKKIRRV